MLGTGSSRKAEDLRQPGKSGLGARHGLRIWIGGWFSPVDLQDEVQKAGPERGWF